MMIRTEVLVVQHQNDCSGGAPTDMSPLTPAHTWSRAVCLPSYSFTARTRRFARPTAVHLERITSRHQKRQQQLRASRRGARMMPAAASAEAATVQPGDFVVS